MTHTRPQVDVLTCTILVLTSLLCSTGTAALQHCKHFGFLRLFFSASSGVSLSFLSLYYSLLCWIYSYISIQHEQWTSPSINQLTHAVTVIYSDNLPWHKPLHIPNMASSNLCHLLVRDMNHYTHLYESTVIKANCIRSMVNLMLEARVRYPLYIVIYCKWVHYTADSLVWGSLTLAPINLYMTRYGHLTGHME